MADGIVCRNCGFHNAPSDDCGSCGTYLGWATAGDAGDTAAGASGAGGSTASDAAGAAAAGASALERPWRSHRWPGSADVCHDPGDGCRDAPAGRVSGGR